MKKEPSTNISVNKKKLYLGIMLLFLAAIAVILVMVIPDKPAKQPETNIAKTDSLAFKKDGIAAFFGKDNKEKCNFEIEIADTPERQKQGLMFRESMYDKQGMLFVNDKEKIQTFWMKNTYLPLDIIFISADSTIVSIVDNTVPFSEDNIVSEAPAQFVLEINAGLSKVHNLVKGDKLKWKKD